MWGKHNLYLVKALVANSGDVSSGYPVTVSFYQGNPFKGGVQIGADAVYVSVDPAGIVSESNETNNVSGQVILVAAQRVFLPLAQRNF